MNGPRHFHSILVGGGPAGMAVLLSAHKHGRLAALLQRGLLIVERADQIGRGQIGEYVINSDSTGTTFVDPLSWGDEGALHAILETPLAQEIASAGAGAVPLKHVGDLMGAIGQALVSILKRYPRSAVFARTEAQCARRLPGGGWQLEIRSVDGQLRTVTGDHLILSTGATQPLRRLQQEEFAGVPVVERWGHKLRQSGSILRSSGFAELQATLREKAHPRVAILGGSTSAMAVAHTLLYRMPEVRFGAGAVTVLHRRPMRIYYPSAEEALRDGYTDFTAADICPVSKRVYRFAGLRLDSGELLMRMCGVGGRAPEPRLRLHLLQSNDPAAIEQIDAADLVIAALGYRPNALPLFSGSGARIALASESSPDAALVDSACRVLDLHQRPVPDAWAIGLAAGFQPRGALGGEPSFRGQANGLWLWQNDIGYIIVDAILREPAHRETTWSQSLSATLPAPYERDPFNSAGVS